MKEAERDREPCRAPARGRGFTLMELMFTLVVAGLLLTVGVPSYMDIVRSNRAAANANELVGALTIARSEAIRRATRITLCRSANLTSCGGAWTDGWILFVDNASSDTAAPSVGEILRKWPAPVGTASISPRAAGAPANFQWVRFLPRGTVRAPVTLPVAFNIEVAGCSDMQGRTVELNAIGRATVEPEACP